MIDDDKLYKLKQPLAHAMTGQLIIGSGLRELMNRHNVVDEQLDEYAVCLEKGEINVK